MSFFIFCKLLVKFVVKVVGFGCFKDFGKCVVIFEVVKVLFIEQGYIGVSMDIIVVQVGVLKLIVYSYFGDKEMLFFEVVQLKCIEMLFDVLFVVDVDGLLCDQLIGIGLVFFELIIFDVVILIQCMMMVLEIDECLCVLFWKVGFECICEVLVDFLCVCVECGELDIFDCVLVGEQFLILVKGEVYMYMMCGMLLLFVECDFFVYVIVSIDFFLCVYVL